jgi:hypothetical protein
MEEVSRTCHTAPQPTHMEEVSRLSWINQAATTQQLKQPSPSLSTPLPMLAPLSCSVPGCEYYTPDKTLDVSAQMQVLMLHMVRVHKMETRDPAH